MEDCKPCPLGYTSGPGTVSDTKCVKVPQVCPAGQIAPPDAVSPEQCACMGGFGGEYSGFVMCADGVYGLVRQELGKQSHAYNTVRVPDVEFHNAGALLLTQLPGTGCNSCGSDVSCHRVNFQFIFNSYCPLLRPAYVLTIQALCVVCGSLQGATRPQTPAPCAPLEPGRQEAPGDHASLAAGDSRASLAPPLTVPAMPPMPAPRARKSTGQSRRPARWLTVCAKQGMVQWLAPAWVSARSVLRARTPLAGTWTRASPAALERPAHLGQQGQASVCQLHRRAQQASLHLQVLFQLSNVPASLALEVRTCDGCLFVCKPESIDTLCMPVKN